MVYTDPPWGIYTREYDTDGNDLLDRITPELSRVLKVGGHFVLEWSKKKLDVLEHVDKNFIFKQMLANVFPYSASKSATGFSCFEPLYWFCNKEKKPPVRLGQDVAITYHDIAYKVWMSHREDGEIHRKSVQNVSHWLILFSRKGDLVLDPFCGSGTVGVACIKMERRFLGFEIDKITYTYAKERVESTPTTRKLSEVYPRVV